MKLLRKEIDKSNMGVITLIPEEPEDMWHAYNLIVVGDTIRSSTIRKIQNESSTGSSTSYRTRTILTIKVETIEFDTQTCMLRLKGRNVVENEYVKLGAYHTLELEQNRKFSIGKHEWDSVALERIETACDPTQSADLAAVVMQDGLANLFCITSNMTINKAKIEVNIPKKRRGFVDQHDKGLHKFYDQVMQAIVSHINFSIVKCLVIASPGFVNDEFYKYMFQQAEKTNNRILLDNRRKFTLIHTSSGFKHSLKEVLSDPVVLDLIADKKATSEVEALETFYKTLQCEPSKAFYGKKHIEKALEAQAIETLLITDTLFRNSDINLRKEYINIVDRAKENGCDVKIFSSLHVSGEQLEQLTGIAAILRFPLPELEDTEDEESDDDNK